MSTRAHHSACAIFMVVLQSGRHIETFEFTHVTDSDNRHKSRSANRGDDLVSVRNKSTEVIIYNVYTH